MLQKIIYDTAANCATRRPTFTTDVLAFDNDGAVGASTVSVVRAQQGTHHDIFTLAAHPITLSDANVGGGSLLWTFPEGLIRIVGGFATLTPTTTSAILTTLNGSKTLSTGLGSVQTVAQASGTLATTEQDIINQFSTTSSATINVAGTAGSGKAPSTPIILDGHTTAAAVYVNVGVPTDTDIDGNATITVSGTVLLIWQWVGDY